MAFAAAVSACLVVPIHISFAPEFGTIDWWFRRLVVDGICRVAVPFFFFSSGFFLAGRMEEAGWYRKALCKRIRTLLIPYLIFNILFCIYSLLLGVIGSQGGSVTWQTLFVVTGLNPYKWPYHGALWFMRSLMVFVLVSPLLKFFVSRKVRMWLVVSGLLFMNWIAVKMGDPWADWAFQLISPYGSIWFILGMHLRLVKYRGVRLLEEVSPDLHIPDWLRRASFPIYLMHGFFICPVGNLVHICAPLLDGWAMVLLKWLLVYGITLFVSVFLHSRMPRCAFVLFGGR